ncbi:MAG: hypothetical protein AAF609_19595 [Cyanobacteria bacterium P01_C01_bin.120]
MNAIPSIQKVGGMAAFANAGVALATLAVAVFLIGPSAIADPNKLIDLATRNPTPLLIQDGLKVSSAVISALLVVAFTSYLRRENLAVIAVAAGFGFLAIFCLLGNAVLSFYGIFQMAVNGEAIAAVPQLNRMIGILAMTAIFLDGVWLLLVNGIALKSQQLPRSLCYLGLAMGVLSLVPPLGIIVLLMGLIWSVWVGRVLLATAPDS